MIVVCCMVDGIVRALVSVCTRTTCSRPFDTVIVGRKSGTVMCPNMEGEVIRNSRSLGIQQGTSQTGEGINCKTTVFIQNETM